MLQIRYPCFKYDVLVYQSTGTLVPVPCSNGPTSIGNTLPSLFLDEFINTATAAGNIVPYCGPSLQTHPSDESTVTSWYLNLPPPPPPSMSLLPNQNIPPPNLNSLTPYPSTSPTVITIPTHSSINHPICAIKPLETNASKYEASELNEAGLFSSISGTHHKNFVERGSNKPFLIQ